MYLAYVMIKRTEENGNHNRFFKKGLSCNPKNEILGLQIYEYLENAIADIGDGTIFENIRLKDEIILARGKMELVTISESDNKADDFSFRFENGLIVSVGTVPSAIDSQLNNSDNKKEDEKCNTFQKFKLGDYVAIQSTNNQEEGIYPGTICTIEEICPFGNNSNKYYGVKPVYKYNTYNCCYYYSEDELLPVYYEPGLRY